MTATHRRGRLTKSGFTIVELLVVIGVLTILMGLLLPALSGVQRRGRKAEESNRIRQVGITWNLYAQSNGDTALPGYLDAESGPGGESVQTAWRVEGRYEFPDGTEIPGPQAAPWTWRLLPFLDYDQETVIGYLGLTEESKLAMSDSTLDDDLVNGTTTERPTTIANHPAFGYNGFYVGGWWDEWLQDPQSGRYHPRPRFYQAREVTTEEATEWERVSVIAQSPSSIHNAARMVLFVSTAAFEAGEYHDTLDVWPGSHFAVPPFLAEREVWRKSTASDQIIEVLNSIPGVPVRDTPIPVARYTDQTTVLHADLHSEPAAPGSLDDQRYWVNGADAPLFMHD